jgi:hypothetical protein
VTNMNRFLGLLTGILLMATSAWSVQQVWTSSNTNTADSLAVLCGMYQVGGTSTTLRGILHEVVVSSAIAATTLTVYNSTYTATTNYSIGPIITGTLGSYTYDTTFPLGMIYTKTGPAQVQILYECY